MMLKNRRKAKFYRRKYSMILTFTFILMMFSIGYAVISTTLSVNGTSKMANATWNVHFDNIVTKTGSVTPTTAPTISNNTSVSFAARLENPGDFYEFNIDVVNGGSIDAMIDSYTMTPTLTTEQQKYFNYSVTYSDGVALADNQLLAHGTTETLKVRFEYLTSNDINDYPEEDQTFNFNLSIDYVQKDEDAVAVRFTGTKYGVYPVANKVILNSTVPDNAILHSTVNEALADWTKTDVMNKSKSYIYYLKHVIESDAVKQSYVVLTPTAEEAAANSGLQVGTYELRGGIYETSLTDKTNFFHNAKVLYDAFEGVGCTGDINLPSTYNPSYNPVPSSYFHCYGTTLRAGAYDTGGVFAYDDNGSGCYINSDGTSSCQ